MESKLKHKEIRDLFDKFLEEEDLNSWTVHKNRRGKILTLRFIEKDGDETVRSELSDRRQTYATYVKRSDKQVQRARARFGYNNTKSNVETRSKTQARRHKT